MEVQNSKLKKFAPFIIGGIVLIIVVLIVFLVLNRDNTPGETPSSSGDTTIEVWGLWEPSEVMQPLIDAYEQENPGTEINYSERTFTNYKQNVFGRLDETEGPGPDVFIMNNSWTREFRDKISPAPSDVITATEMGAEFYPTAENDLTIDGEVYAVPLMFEGLGMYYNKDHLEDAGIADPPDDWNKFRDAMSQLTKVDTNGEIEQAGAAIGTANNVNHYFELVSLLMLQNNVEMMGVDGATAQFANSRGASTMEFYTSFVNPESENYAWSDALGNDLQLFANGELSIMFAPSWRAFDVNVLNPTLDFDIAPMPQLPRSENTQPEVINWADYWTYSVSANADNKALAWDFIDYLSQEEQLQTFHTESSKIRAFGQIYPRPSMAGDLADQPFTDAYIQMAPTARDWEMGDDERAKEIFGAMITSVNGGEDAQNALEEAAIQLTNELGGDPTAID